MNERKTLLPILFVVVYCFYSVWLSKENVEEKNEVKDVLPTSDALIIHSDKVITASKKKNKTIPLYYNNACSILQIFTQKPKKKLIFLISEHERNTITSIAISMFLLVLIINAVLDVLKVKEEERLQRKLNPDGVRRQSLSEFANKKPIRKFGLQLFQIVESKSNNNSEDEKPRRNAMPYPRGNSINSYLNERKPQNESLPASLNEASGSEPKLVKRQSAAKLIGGRPVPMVRRCSYPAFPVNPEVQALMLATNRQPSVDSDDEDGRGKRVRIIRRY